MTADIRKQGCGARQNYPDFHEFARLRIDLDRAALLLDDNFTTDGKAEPGAFSGKLCREDSPQMKYRPEARIVMVATFTSAQGGQTKNQGYRLWHQMDFDLSLFRFSCLLIVPEGLMIEPANLLQIDRRFWQLEFHVFHRSGNNLRDREVPEPLVV